MEIRPILYSLRRNRLGALLIALQIALTLAIVCNSLSIIVHHLQHMRRPTGIDELNIFTLSNEWVGTPTDLKAKVTEDLAALRSLPGVVDAEATNSFPLHGGGWSEGLKVKPDQKHSSAQTAQYFVDEHALTTYGIKLVGGRWFNPDEIKDLSRNENEAPALIIVTEALARNLFPAGDALGKVIYPGGPTSARIIGIVERAQTPWAGFSWGESFIENSTFMPYLFLNNGVEYVVRTRPGQRSAVMQAAQDKLYAVTQQRVIENVASFSETRSNIYQQERASSVILGTVSALLLAVTAFGVVGLTTYWVAQRRQQIGMRRALGARRIDILRYFHTENLLIAGTGGIAGIALGLGGNVWLASSLELTRMSFGFICAGAVIVLALSQTAVFWPALRAATTSPASAIRNL